MISNISFDNNNIIWEQGLNININPQIIFIFDILTNKTTAYITKQLQNTSANVDFKCIWDGIFINNNTIDVLLASSTAQPCRIKDNQTQYCSLQCANILITHRWNKNATNSTQKTQSGKVETTRNYGL